jgi:hypothetical protein
MLERARNSKTPAAQTMNLRPDLDFFPLDDELVVFSQEAQSLVGLNAAAAFLVRKLKDATPATALAAALSAEFGLEPDTADDWVASTLEALSSHDLLDDGRSSAFLVPADVAEGQARKRRQAEMPSYQPFEVEVEAHYRLLETTALVRYATKAQMRMVDAVIGHLKLEGAASPDLVIEIAAAPWGENQLASNIYRDQQPEDKAEKLSKLGPLVKSALWVTAVNSYDFLLNLHAGVVTNGKSGILLPAASGSGKSSLTAALTHAGFRYLSDEVGLIERGTFRVPPVPLAVCVKAKGWNLMSRYFPEIATLPIHLRNDDKVVRYLPPRPASVQSEPAFISHIIFPRYAKAEKTMLQPLSRSAGFTRLMDQCLALSRRLDRDNVGDMIRWIAKIDCYALTFSSLDEAVALVQRAVSGQ